MAAAYEEWADYYEFQLQHRAAELPGDNDERVLVEAWAEEMTYAIRRCAAEARGETLEKWVPQRVRRPDLHAVKEAQVQAILDKLDVHPQASKVIRPG